MIDELEFEELKDRVDQLEATVNKSNFIDGLSAAVDKVTGAAFALIQADPHQWSTRGCQTCRTVSGLIEKPFGCILYAEQRKGT
jgi:hypothetical protein